MYRSYAIMNLYAISNSINVRGCFETPRATADAFECSGNLQKLDLLQAKANCPDNNVKHQELVIPFLRAELQTLIMQETNLL